LRITDMRHIYIILTVLILSSACNAESSPNAPPATTLPASPNTPPVAQPTLPPTTIQPTTSHSDETTRVERDAYKQVVEAHQETLTTIKWGIGIIGTLVLALITYALFKDKKEYENAVKGAEKACEKAEQWEEKAKSTSNKIDDLVKEKLAEIKNKFEEQSKNAADKLDKLVEAKVKESIQKIDTKAEKERQISQLWSDASRFCNEGKHEEACEKYAELVKLKPDIYEAYNNWGNALFDWAKIKGDEKLFEQACQKYEQAAKINPDEPVVYKNWGNALANWAKLKIRTSEYESLLKQAEEKSLKAESLQKGSSAYNLACIYALGGNKEECRKWLLAGQEAGTLVTRDKTMEDKDLDSVRNEAWFKEIKWKGER
jgi:tetratricopeptide (TPR) repeat protein